MLEELRDAPSVAGAKQVRRALTAKQVKTLFLAEDADPALTGPLADLAGELGVTVVRQGTMKDLGAACGIAVKAAVAATLI